MQKKSSPTVKFDPVSGKINIKSISQIYKEKKIDILPQQKNNKKKKIKECVTTKTFTVCKVKMEAMQQ